MPRDKHTDDLRNVNEGDDVTLVLGEGREYDAHVTSRFSDQADPRTGHIRETTTWVFRTDQEMYKLYVNITEGLKSTPDDPDFPLHHQVWNETAERAEGYITSLKIHGQLA